MKTIFFKLFLVVLITLSACKKDKVQESINYKKSMRSFVRNISNYAKNINPNFIIIPQNGVELISTTAKQDGSPCTDYINAIDGIGQENLNYGYHEDNQETPTQENEHLRAFLEMAKSNGNIKIMITDYCSTISKIDNAYNINNSHDYISFIADHRALDNIPTYPIPIHQENADVITKLQQARNFLYLINPDNLFTNQQAFVDAIKSTNYDVLIMDFFYQGEIFTPIQIEQLKQKANGGKRLLIAYMSIGEAEDYRYYWQPDWTVGNPSIIEKENPKWKGNYVVRYWEPEWQNIIFGNEDSYLKKILNAHFDGVYLDIIDAYEQFED